MLPFYCEMMLKLCFSISKICYKPVFGMFFGTISVFGDRGILFIFFSQWKSLQWTVSIQVLSFNDV